METIGVALTAVATSFDASTGEVRGSGRDSVAENSTVAHVASGVSETLFILGEHGSGESVLGVVGQLEAVLFGGASPEVESRSEELFTPRGRVDFDVLQNHGLNVVTALEFGVRHVKIGRSESNGSSIVGNSSLDLTDQLGLLTLHGNRS